MRKHPFRGRVLGRISFEVGRTDWRRYYTRTHFFPHLGRFGRFLRFVGPTWPSGKRVQKKGKEGVCPGQLVPPFNCSATSFCIYEPVLKNPRLHDGATGGPHKEIIVTAQNGGTLAASLRRAAMATPEDPACCVVLLRAGCLPCPVYYHGIWDPSAQSVGVGAGTFLLRRGTF